MTPYEHGYYETLVKLGFDKYAKSFGSPERQAFMEQRSAGRKGTRDLFGGNEGFSAAGAKPLAQVAPGSPQDLMQRAGKLQNKEVGQALQGRVQQHQQTMEGFKNLGTTDPRAAGGQRAAYLKERSGMRTRPLMGPDPASQLTKQPGMLGKMWGKVPKGKLGLGLGLGALALGGAAAYGMHGGNKPQYMAGMGPYAYGT